MKNSSIRLARRILLVEDHPLFLSAVQEILRRHYPDFAVAVASTAAQALTVLVACRREDGAAPTAVLCDLRLPDNGDPAWLERVRAHTDAATHIAVLSAEHDPTRITAVLRHGADSFISKNLGVEALLDKLSAVLGVVPQTLPPTPARKAHIPAEFSVRQTAVAQELLKGHSNKEIARSLGLGPETIKSHVSEIIAKLGARNRTEAVLKLTSGGQV